MEEEKIRSFIALDLDSATKDFLEEIVTKWKKRYPQAKWVRKDQLHVTLAFFPAIPVGCTRNIGRILEELGNRFPSFYPDLSKIGVFPSWNRVRVLWVGFDEDGEKRMKQIGEVLLQNLKGEGITVEEDKKELVPHITLARLRYPVSFSPADWKIETPPVAAIRRIALFQSTLTPQGPIYKELFAFDLKG
ncbi:MAG: RNA 2',3'-cyclic phosphodiesterase [Candidatus Atribacteria bacterium]|nr:RNA 2',3'-cyclic phosphodiesterase [Candidatus Atribacteria bacterium]